MNVVIWKAVGDRFNKKIANFIILSLFFLVIILHLGGMSKLVAVKFPEKKFTIEDISKAPYGIYNFEHVDRGRIKSTSIEAWVYIDYQVLDIKNPVILDFEILDTNETQNEFIMYYHPSYVLQRVEEKVGEIHVPLSYRTSGDRGIRLDVTRLEDKEFQFGEFVINDNSTLTKVYLQRMDRAMFYLLFIMISIISLLWDKGKQKKSDFIVAMCLILLVITTLLGGAIIGYLGLLGLLVAQTSEKTSAFSLMKSFKLLLCGAAGIFTVILFLVNYDSIVQMLFSVNSECGIKNAWVIVASFFIIDIIKDLLGRNESDFFRNLSCKAIIIMLIYIILEIMITGYINAFAPGQWMNYLRTDIFTAKMTANILVLWMFFFAFSAILSVNWSIVIFAVVGTILIVGNLIKIRYQGSLFKLSDIFVLKEAVGIAKQYVSTKWMIFLLIVAVIIGLLFFLNRQRIKDKLKVSVNKSSFLFLPALFAVIFFLNNNGLKIIGIDATVKYKQEKENLDALGVGLYYYYMVLQGSMVDRPQGYGESLISEVNQYKDNKAVGIETINPNVILILGESLFRADQIPDVEFNYSLFENTEPYMNCNVISPSYGGRTAVAEAEALTGYSNFFLEDDAVIYTTYLKSPKHKIGSLAREFGSSGYTTIAMHPNTANYYNRDVVYQCMGFDIYYSIADYQAVSSDLLNDGLVKDSKFFDFMIQKLEENRNPIFIFGVTIAGHSPYGEKYGETEVKAKSNRYSEKELKELSQYGQTAKDFDEQLGKLFAYLDTCGKPTLVYVFGDHVPPLAINYSNGYLNSNETKYTTPLIVYSNYSQVKIEESVMSLSQVAPQIIRDSGIEHSAYFDFLYEFRKKHPILHKEFVIEEDEEVRLYEKIQYDALSGERFLLNPK